MRSFFRAKIHRATITEADLHYEGSLTIDSELMEMADIADNTLRYTVAADLVSRAYQGMRKAIRGRVTG